MTGRRTRTAAAFFLVTLLVLWATQGIGAKKKPPLHPVNLNTASAVELQQVPGIGPATADKILQARKSYGSFKSVDDLQAINGIGPKKLDKIRKYLTVKKPAAPAGKSTTKKTAGAETAPAAKTHPSPTSVEAKKSTPAPQQPASEVEEQ